MLNIKLQSQLSHLLVEFPDIPLIPVVEGHEKFGKDGKCLGFFSRCQRKICVQGATQIWFYGDDMDEVLQDFYHDISVFMMDEKEKEKTYLNLKWFDAILVFVD